MDLADRHRGIRDNTVDGNQSAVVTEVEIVFVAGPEPGSAADTEPEVLPFRAP